MKRIWEILGRIFSLNYLTLPPAGHFTLHTPLKNQAGCYLSPAYQGIFLKGTTPPSRGVVPFKCYENASYFYVNLHSCQRIII